MKFRLKFSKKWLMNFWKKISKHKKIWIKPSNHFKRKSLMVHLFLKDSFFAHIVKFVNRKIQIQNKNSQDFSKHTLLEVSLELWLLRLFFLHIPMDKILHVNGIVGIALINLDNQDHISKKNQEF